MAHGHGHTHGHHHDSNVSKMPPTGNTLNKREARDRRDDRQRNKPARNASTPDSGVRSGSEPDDLDLMDADDDGMGNRGNVGGE